ncbi:DUF1080 domain-containing protein [Phycisphaeraceae bacterium D3-23]
MRNHPLLAAVTCLLLLPGCAAANADDAVADETTTAESEWTALFDGESLDGWAVRCLPGDVDKVFWSVEDGELVANSMERGDHGYIWLIHEQELTDFELRLKFKADRDSPGNSGIQIRSRWDPDDGEGWLNGPQIDLHPPAPFRTGFIYDETRGHQRWIHPSLPDWNIRRAQAFPPDGAYPEGWRFAYDGDDTFDVWNTLVIRCVGTQITTTLNGLTISDYDGEGVLDDEHHEAADCGMAGQIALQLHANDELHLRFKDIEVREIGEME